MGAQAASKTKVVDLLYRAQVLQRAQCEQLLAFCNASIDRAEDVIVDNELMTEAALLKALSAIYQTHFVSSEKLSRADIPKATVQLIPKRVAETLAVFPVVFDPKTSALSVVTPDPDNAEMLKEVKLVSGATSVKAFVALPGVVTAAIKKHHGGDGRAFERYQRAAFHPFGQQVMTDGRIMTGKETQQRNATVDEDPFERQQSPAARRAAAVAAEDPFERQTGSRRATVEDPFERRSGLGTGVGARRQTLSEPDEGRARGFDFDGPSVPPPLPKRASVKHTTNDMPLAALSLPPPPQPVAPPVSPPTASIPARPPPRSEPAPQAAPQPARSRAPSDPDLPRAQEPSSLTTRLGTSPPVSERGPVGNSSQNVFQNDQTIELLTVMVSLLENARQELRGHSAQVARLLKRVAERMNLDKAHTYAVVAAGHIHDLGKMGQFHLTALNCSEYEGHRIAAQKACETPLRLLEGVRLPPAIKNAVLHMYERFDGKGFPDKLAGKEIPLGARLLAVADTYADLTQNPRNPFRKVLSPAEAMDVLIKHDGTIFDSSILDLFKVLVLGEDMRAKLLANRHRALIVDPDPEESTVLELRMVEQGFDVKIARTVDGARKLLSMEGAEFDLVVCEVELPDADGLAFLSEARKESWGRDLAWVVYTHKQGRAEAQRAFEMNAMDYVAKPSQADVLVAKIKAMLEQRSQSGKGGAAKGVSGSLREMGLPDIVQVLFHGRKTGKLAIRSDAGKAGEIHFLEGAIANAVFGSITGADAFYAMVRFSDGEFALDPSFVPPKRIVVESAEALLLEGMRRLDEGI